MSFDVGINIKSQADLGAAKQADDAIKQLGKTLNESKGASEGASAGVEKAGSSIELLHSRGLGAHRAIGMFADTVGQMGEAGHIAAGGMIAAATGVGIAGIGIGIASTAIALFVEHLKSAAQAQEKLRDAFRTGDLGTFEKEIDAIDQKLVALGANSDALRGQQAGGGFLAKFLLVDDRLFANQRVQVDDQKKRAELVSQQQEILAKTFAQTTLQVEFQTEAVGKSVAELEELAHESRIVQALQRGLANASQATKDEFIAASTALKNARIAEDVKKTTESIKDQVLSLQYEQAAVGKTGETLIGLQTAQKIDQVNVALQRAGHLELAGQLDAEIAALGRLQVANSRIQGGQQGIDKFQQNFGVQFDSNKQQAGQQLAQNFVAVFNQMKDDRGAETQLNQAFGSFIQQAIAMGLPNIGDLLASSGMSERDFAGLKQTLASTQLGVQQVDEAVSVFQYNAVGGSEKIGEEIRSKLVPVYGTDLVAAIDKSAQSVFRWTTDFDAAQKKITEQAANIGTTLAANLQQGAQAADDLARRIAGIPDVSRKTIIVDVQYSGGALPALEQEIQRGTGLDPGFRVYN